MRRSLILVIVIMLITLFTSLFIVQEGQRGIILRFGKVLRNKENKPLICNPGLHIKIPVIDTVENLDARIKTMENQADRFVTMEKKDLIVDSYIKWRISDFSRYYLATGGGDISHAEVLIKRKFSDRLRSELGRLDVKGIVTDSRNRLMTDVRNALNNGTSCDDEARQQHTTAVDHSIIASSAEDATRIERETGRVQTDVNSNSMANMGIEIVDVRIKQINLPSEVSDAIYQRMRAEREAVARHHRSQGQEEAEKIRAIADYKVTCTLSEAKRQALIMYGEADAESAKIYAQSFSKDPEFYTFIRSLRAYEKSFNTNKNTIILSSDSDFFRFMKSPEKNEK